MLARTVDSPPAHPRPTRRAPLRWFTFAAALGLNLAVLYAPDPGGPAVSVPGLDKVVHAAIFLVLTLSGLWAGLRPRWFVPAVLLHAVASEAVQGLVLPARSGDAWDVVADAAGVWLALVSVRRLARARGPSSGAP